LYVASAYMCVYSWIEQAWKAIKYIS
jgi:hypothetical protein